MSGHDKTVKKNSTSHKKMRAATLIKVIRAIRERAKCKNEIQEKTGLSWGSCSETISRLVESELLITYKIDDKRGGKGGRKTTAFKFHDDRNLLLGMEIKANSILCSLTNFGAEEIQAKKFDFKNTFTQENIFQVILSTFNEFLDEFKIDKKDVAGLLLSLTGAVDSDNNRLIYSPRYLDMSDIDFSRFRELVPSIKYFSIEHDIHAQASSVVQKNKWMETNFALLHFGEGVGMTIFNDGFYNGAKGFAGEIGHINHQIKEINKTCTCGRKNCYETILSTSGITGLANEICDLNIETIGEISETQASNPILINLVVDAMVDLITTVSNILNPMAIYIGGEAIEPFKKYIKPNIELRIKNEAWLGGPDIIRWFSSDDINCAYGTILNSSDKIIEQYIIDNLI